MALDDKLTTVCMDLVRSPQINSCLFDTCEKKTNSNAEGKWSQGNWVSPNPSPPAEALVEETAAPCAPGAEARDSVPPAGS